MATNPISICTCRSSNLYRRTSSWRLRTSSVAAPGCALRALQACSEKNSVSCTAACCTAACTVAGHKQQSKKENHMSYLTCRSHPFLRGSQSCTCALLRKKQCIVHCSVLHCSVHCSWSQTTEQKRKSHVLPHVPLASFPERKPVLYVCFPGIDFPYA